MLVFLVSEHVAVCLETLKIADMMFAPDISTSIF